jgi:hypothetical protein
MLSPHHKKRVPRPSRVRCERAGLLADIAAVDHQIQGRVDNGTPAAIYSLELVLQIYEPFQGSTA